VPIWTLVRHRAGFDRFVKDELLLACVLTAGLVLFLTDGHLRTSHDLPRLRLTLMTLYAVGGALVSLLCAVRFSAEGRRFDLFLSAGFFTTSVSWAVFGVGPLIATSNPHASLSWARVVGNLLGWGLVAYAPFARGVVEDRKAALRHVLGLAALALTTYWILARNAANVLPALGPSSNGRPALLSFLLAAQAFTNGLTVIGFARRYHARGEDLDRWLAFGGTLMLFASLHFEFTPPAGSSYVSQGDYLRLIAYVVLLAGVWRAIQSSESGRAVAEERARVARDIHDGLAQYLFAVSSHVAMLERGAPASETLPRLKQAALAAQQEARYAILTLSSAAGSAPFDAALRRYVDVLTSDGMLEVELDVDNNMGLAPDEQIEVFRIVQEGLANARKHASARRAWVTIGRRGTDRLVEVRDDGAGFEPFAEAGGEGLKNMRQRAAAIGGAFSLRSAPGGGTALEIVLRS
jgi:signal transduction histidine kinase